MRFRQADEKPAHFKIGQASTSGMLEGDLISDLPGNAVDQVLQVLGFPAVQAGVVHFHQPVHVFCGDDKLIWLPKSEVFLVVTARIHYKTQFSTWKYPASGAD